MFDLVKEIENGEYLFPNTIEEIDEMSGKEFEIYLFYFFKKNGLDVQKTKDSADSGIDLIIDFKIDGRDQRLGIQAKRWKSNVNVQEIRNMSDGQKKYKLNNVWIITTSGLTSDAHNTALNSNYVVKDRKFVEQTLIDLKSLKNVSFRKQEKKTDTKPITKDLNPSEVDLYDELRELRRKIAEEKKIDLWLVFSNETAMLLVKKKPKKLEDLYEIKGLGDKKIADFGEKIIDLLKAYN